MHSEAWNAIAKTFAFEGDLRIKPLWSNRDAAQFRANWFRKIEGENRITHSLFVRVLKTPDGLLVGDDTIAR